MAGSLNPPPFDGLASGPDPWDLVVKVSPLGDTVMWFISRVMGRERNRF
jgi:hypothetical protein